MRVVSKEEYDRIFENISVKDALLEVFSPPIIPYQLVQKLEGTKMKDERDIIEVLDQVVSLIPESESNLIDELKTLVCNKNIECAQLKQKLEDAHNELDLLTIQRRDEHKQSLTVASRLQLLRELREQQYELIDKELDKINVPRDDCYGRRLSLLGRIQSIKELGVFSTNDDYLNSDIYKSIKKYMLDNYEEHLDSARCLLLTPLVEDAANHFNKDHWLDDSEHWIWDLACLVQDALKTKKLINV